MQFSLPATQKCLTPVLPSAPGLDKPVWDSNAWTPKCGQAAVNCRKWSASRQSMPQSMVNRSLIYGQSDFMDDRSMVNQWLCEGQLMPRSMINLCLSFGMVRNAVGVPIFNSSESQLITGPSRWFFPAGLGVSWCPWWAGHAWTVLTIWGTRRSKHHQKVERSQKHEPNGHSCRENDIQPEL